MPSAMRIEALEGAIGEAILIIIRRDFSRQRKTADWRGGGAAIIGACLHLAEGRQAVCATGRLLHNIAGVEMMT